MPEAITAGREVLEFELGPETYCVDIEYVEEIVETGTLTEIPNSPSYVKGVMDLRGRTTTIIDPTTVLDLSHEASGDRIIIFDPEQMEDTGAVGWVVDGADRVVRVEEERIEDAAPTDDAAINGVIKHDDEFVIYVDPTAIES
ncbi:MAG: chemotaxis protein CheW [Halobacteriales archaeon]|nr:chemotaxis protein CheW [Halobacteriales archaeon]